MPADLALRTAGGTPAAWAHRRYLVLVAGPGYGKTTALRSRVAGGSVRWVEREAIEALRAGVLPVVETASTPDDRLWVVLDDIPVLGPDAARALLDWAETLPEPVGVAVSSRWPIDAPLTRWLGRGVLSEVGPADLALSAGQVAAVLRDDYDLRDPSLPAHLHAATCGWPALVHLGAQVLLRHGAGLARGEPPLGADLVAALAEPGTAVSAYIREEVLAGLPARERRLVVDLSRLDPVSVGLAVAIGHDDPARTIDWLSRTGLLLPAGPSGRHRLVPLVAAVAQRERWQEAAPSLARIAAGWYAEHGPPVAAARAYHEAGDLEACQKVLAGHGEEILAAGGCAAFIAMAESLPEHLLDDRIRMLWGDALRITGNIAGALAIFDALTDEAGSVGWDPAMVWRVGLLHYLRADLRLALDVLARADPTRGRPADHVMVAAWMATTHSMLGDASTAAEHARLALARAAEVGDDRATAAAHIAAAMALKAGGDPARTDEHFALGLRAARRAGDTGQVIRILLNQSHQRLARAEYLKAAEVAANAVRTAEPAGPAGMLVVALCNEGEALGRIGRFDDAIDRFNRAIATARRMGSQRGAVALTGLGDVHRRRGWHEQARAAYEQSVRIARVSGEMQALVPALTGLARIRAAADPHEAAALLDEADACANGLLQVQVCIARGWHALARGDRVGAARIASAASAEVRPRDEPGWLAETLELRAASEVDGRAIRAALTEAHGIWRDAGACVEADRIVATLGAMPAAGTEDRLAAMLARERLIAAGVHDDALTVPLVCGAGGASQVTIAVLGRFEVRVGGEPVPPTAWQSRKARDLLRILVARRARAIGREELGELLWPEDDPGRTGHRLSVLLSIVRGVLDPDRSMPNDQFVVAEKAGVALDASRISIDVEDFLADVAYGCRLYDQAAFSRAETVLTAALRSYLGDAFDDEPYADWTVPLREAGRAAHLRALRTLARLARRSGDVDLLVGYLLSILEQDPYEEDAHRMLISALTAAGRHGEAHRAFERYRDAMRVIGVPVRARRPTQVGSSPR